jgi:hypothetical protein
MMMIYHADDRVIFCQDDDDNAFEIANALDTNKRPIPTT